jgi:hypothetical protein
MKNEEINNQTTLFRFVSLRSAELTKKENQNKRFIFHPDNQTGAFFNAVHNKDSNTTIDAGASYASNVSKEESNKQAVNQAKEITQRAMERIVSRVKNEKTVKTTDEFTEVNTHVFDNTESGEHVSGVFRFINAIYKNQIYNYGKRLMYEFMIPQPSKLHLLGMEVSKSSVSSVKIDKPIDPRTTVFSDFTKINENNYQLLASKYNADVNQFPKQEMYVGKSIEHFSQSTNTGATKTMTIKVPDGVIYMSLEFNLGLKTTKNEYIKAF